MFDRLRSGVLAGGGALLLVLALSGMAMGASLTSDSPAGDTSFVDIDGDGVADHCQTEAAVENTGTAQAAFDAADLNDDGEISLSEAAQSGWTGGENCNHGGYVSEVAQAGDSCEAEDTEEPEGTGTGTEEGTETGTEEEAAPEADADCEAADDETEETEEAAPADEETCEAVAAPEIDPATDTSEWNHGAWVSWVANSPATGGKNCNHGGAVSEASKAAKEAAKAAKEAARAERDAKKAEKKAARELHKQEHQAGKSNKGHGKPN
jgi:hypothetical protein